MKDTPNTASFIGYEYKSLTVNRRMKSVYADGYQNFGWKLEDVSAPPDGGRRPFHKIQARPQDPQQSGTDQAAAPI